MAGTKLAAGLWTEPWTGPDVITTAADFYAYIGKPVGSKFRMSQVADSNHNFGGDGSTYDVKWRATDNAYMHQDIECIDTTTGFLTFKVARKSDGTDGFLGDANNAGANVNWAGSGTGPFSQWQVVVTSHGRFYLQQMNQDSSHTGRYIGPGNGGEIIYQVDEADRIELEVEADEAILVTKGEWDQVFGPEDFKLYFEDNTGTKWYLKSFGSNSASVFTNDPAQATMLDTYDSYGGLSFGTANNAGGSRIISQNADFIWGRDDGYCSGNNCKHYVYVLRDTQMFTIQQLIYPDTPYFDNVIKDGDNCGFTTNKHYKWGIER